MNFDSTRRIRLIGWCILGAALFIAVRLYFLQVVRANEFTERADRRYAESAEFLFNRGSIFFTEKGGERVVAASQKNGFVLALDATKITDAEAAYQILVPFISLSREEFLTHAEKRIDTYKELAHRLSLETADSITALKIPGVVIAGERWRFYPGGVRAAQALGFVGYDGARLVGRYGLERYYEDVLGKAHSSPYKNFFAELIGAARGGTSTLSGSVVVGIEPSVQSYLEQVLKSTASRFSSRETAGIVMNPKTGEIIAIATVPSFDPNNFQKEKDWRVFVNPLVENVYEFGSIMKPLTMAAAIDAGVVTPETVYDDRGFQELDGKTFYNFDKKARGEVSMQEVLSQSLNTGAAFVALKMGTEAFAKYLLSFGIGDETGIDLPNEASGLVDNLKSPRQIEYATASFGQGIATTPIAMTRALAALANKGTLPNPHLATRVSYDLGTFSFPSFGEPKRVLALETAETVTRMLVKVVDTALLGGSKKLEHWSVAAKTGTAQIAKPISGGYYDDRFLHSFFGYFPAYEPRFIVFLYTVEPKSVSFASHTLTDPFFDMAKFLLNYYAIPPDR
ncbi:MAG: cell division protein FtsI (penicillin-binding protein 3) [Parcubacteria group bacterium Gr01-1014_17]|nr:MAG: cell division protein FtsI (penicillin-binding protein 3) [Parcubacteria group bacterium Gr01-1014_17]